MGISQSPLLGCALQLVILANAAVSPIILPFGLWWMMASWVMWRHHLLFIFERSHESGGMVRSPPASSVLDGARAGFHVSAMCVALTARCLTLQMWHQIFDKTIW